MWPDRVSNPGPLTYESGARPTALRAPAMLVDWSSNVVESFKIFEKRSFKCHRVHA